MSIDFPAPATDGQLFSASNGVVYQYSAAYTSWLAQNPAPSLGGTGEVQAGGGTFSGVIGSDVPVIFPTINTGNSGLWLNTSNGRYTPPAGKYFIQSTTQCTTPAAGGSWTLAIRKNGTRLPVTGGTAGGGASTSVPITVGTEIEANGADYFEFVANLNSAGSWSVGGGQFTAFPLTGMQGPQGLPAAGGSVIAEINLASASIAMSFFSLAAKTIDISFWLAPTTAGQQLLLRTAVGSSVTSTSTYYTYRNYGTGATSGSDTQSAQSGYVISTGGAAGGVNGKIHFPAHSSGQFGAFGVGQYYDAAGAIINAGFAGPIGNGFQLIWSGGSTFVAGSYCRVIGWP